MTSDAPSLRRGDYGLDAPGIVYSFIALGMLGIACIFVSPHLPAPFNAIVGTLAWPGCSLGASGLFMWTGSRFRKVTLRETLLDSLQLKGDERVLDLGCGRGLLLTAAARRLPHGRVIGVDLWQNKDQSGNASGVTLANAETEGVRERVEVVTGDMRKLPFPDGSFDAVVSSWAVHNVPDAAGRRQAIEEVARVLRPGGRLLMIDIFSTREYVQTLHRLGWSEVARGEVSFVFLTPSYVVRARKP